MSREIPSSPFPTVISFFTLRSPISSVSIPPSRTSSNRYPMSSRQPTEETFPRPKRYLPYRENDSRFAFQVRSYEQPKEKTIPFCKFQRIDRRIVEIVSTKERFASRLVSFGWPCSRNGSTFGTVAGVVDNLPPPLPEYT